MSRNYSIWSIRIHGCHRCVWYNSGFLYCQFGALLQRNSSSTPPIPIRRKRLQIIISSFELRNRPVSLLSPSQYLTCAILSIPFISVLSFTICSERHCFVFGTMNYYILIHKFQLGRCGQACMFISRKSRNLSKKVDVHINEQMRQK